MDDFPEDLAVRVRNVGKTYRLGVISRRTLRDELVYRWLRLRGRDPKSKLGRIDGRERVDTGLFHALDDVSFDIRKGETVGLIGRNGAGKSTMLKILARITTPTTGEAWIRGRVGSMLEVGTGFHPELTGRENIYLNGTILGMSKKEIDAKFDEIVEFSEIGEFLDTPVKRYSSGMYVKLAFSIASSLDNDVLLLDEVLAVGDAAFRRKSLARMKEIAASGRTILFVSHSMANIRDICTRCIWLDRGRIAQNGPMQDVADAYDRYSGSGPDTELSASVRDKPRKPRPLGKLRFSAIEACGPDGSGSPPTCGAPAEFRIVVNVSARVREAVFSLELFAPSGAPLTTFPSFLLGKGLSLEPGLHTVVLSIPKFPLTRGVYRVGVYAATDGIDSDHLENALVFRANDGDFFGHGKTLSNGLTGRIVLCEHSWSVR